MTNDEMWEPTRFAIGEPWPWEPEWVAERGFRWLPDTNVLLLVEDNVTPAMCESLTGHTEVALIGHGPLLGLLVRFGDEWGWAETLVWRRPGQGIPESLESGPEDGHLVFKVILVDAGTKIIEHMRAFTVSSHFTRALAREAKDRWAQGTTLEEASAAMADFSARYPTQRAVLKSSFARSRSGD